MSEPWNIAHVLISAASGAVAGGLTSIAIGASKAEREERGKRRIEVRTEVGRAVRAFRHEYTQARLQRLESQPASADKVFSVALSLAAAAVAAARILPPQERLLLRWRVGSVVGAEMIGLATLQPERTEEEPSAALLHMVAERFRCDPRESIAILIDADPLEATWDDVLQQVEKLGRKYP